MKFYTPVVNLIGGPGTGKSTTMAGTFFDAVVEVQFLVAQNNLDFVLLIDTEFMDPDVNRMELASGSRLKAQIVGGTTETNDISVDIMPLT